MNESNPKFGVVVLNYRTYEDTLACVDSLKKQDYANYAVVVVENGSPNESAEVLKNAYSDVDNVFLIISEENLGFARGNNLGIRFATETLCCNFVFVLNSDTVVPLGVFKQVVSSYKEEVGVISPSVCNVDGDIMPPSENSDDIIRQVRIRKRGLYLARFLGLPVIRALYSAHSHRKVAMSSRQRAWDEKVVKPFFLQGCSYFLTPSFFKYYTQLYPETFLYWEEINLLLYLQKVGLKSIYVKTPPVFHKGAGSTADLYPDKERAKRKLSLSFDSYKKSKKMFRMTYDEIKNRYC